MRYRKRMAKRQQASVSVNAIQNQSGEPLRPRAHAPDVESFVAEPSGADLSDTEEPALALEVEESANAADPHLQETPAELPSTTSPSSQTGQMTFVINGTQYTASPVSSRTLAGSSTSAPSLPFDQETIIASFQEDNRHMQEAKRPEIERPTKEQRGGPIHVKASASSAGPLHPYGLKSGTAAHKTRAVDNDGFQLVGSRKITTRSQSQINASVPTTHDNGSARRQ
ncbi:hypothetical protein BGZ51_009445 [Haplosporangium sp. Z 767]|nr:hypothetical protein BGZ51_009445 [Haplosporangium sp. Z 767]